MGHIICDENDCVSFNVHCVQFLFKIRSKDTNYIQHSTKINAHKDRLSSWIEWSTYSEHHPYQEHGISTNIYLIPKIEEVVHNPLRCGQHRHWIPWYVMIWSWYGYGIVMIWYGYDTTKLSVFADDESCYHDNQWYFDKVQITCVCVCI